MSAREELFESLMPLYRARYAPGEEDSANALIDAYRAEVLEEVESVMLDIDTEFQDPANERSESELLNELLNRLTVVVYGIEDSA